MKRGAKKRMTLKKKLQCVLFPRTPEDWHDEMAVIWRAVIISALVAVVLA